MLHDLVAGKGAHAEIDNRDEDETDQHVPSEMFVPDPPDEGLGLLAEFIAEKHEETSPDREGKALDEIKAPEFQALHAPEELARVARSGDESAKEQFPIAESRRPFFNLWPHLAPGLGFFDPERTMMADGKPERVVAKRSKNASEDTKNHVRRMRAHGRGIDAGHDKSDVVFENSADENDQRKVPQAVFVQKVRWIHEKSSSRRGGRLLRSWTRI